MEEAWAVVEEAERAEVAFGSKDLLDARLALVQVTSHAFGPQSDYSFVLSDLSRSVPERSGSGMIKRRLDGKGRGRLRLKNLRGFHNARVWGGGLPARADRAAFLRCVSRFCFVLFCSPCHLPGPPISSLR